MRLLLTLLILAVSSMALAACTNPHQKGNGPPHCPPGHAKKGWCVPDQHDHKHHNHKHKHNH